MHFRLGSAKIGHLRPDTAEIVSDRHDNVGEPGTTTTTLGRCRHHLLTITDTPSPDRFNLNCRFSTGSDAGSQRNDRIWS